MRILIADDDRVSQRMMERMLQANGYDVVCAANGREAADLLSSPDRPRLALINWMMPELDGPGVCREIRARKEEAYVYIILLTSKQLSEDIVKGLEAGADDYLTKPCHAAELKARLHNGRRILQLEDKLVEAREEMRYKATHDPLTSLWDRGAILSLLRAEMARARREGIPVSLLLCDVDHFKQVNDRYGHQKGDEVLEEVARRLSHAVRPYDAVGRYGGEEFLVVLAGCGERDARNRAEQVRIAVTGATFETPAGSISTTVSIGGFTLQPADAAQPVQTSLALVDAALYQAKATGRNRVVFSDGMATAHVDGLGTEAGFIN